ncbi:type III secretion system outer membrane ring subunit SctC [Burkholderia ubonensis]|uniref:type III secretion system outer membrane ring subunit SctC n=1 Tax=Burkholderia ubonensis TaxID=101571 RepID=UPI00075711DC|nr:type III secretion system outer membrane ring subunit SctC [Burkholderia ubonensis]KVC71759.1 type III secretion protein [Burkholderia ubonensis]
MKYRNAAQRVATLLGCWCVLANVAQATPLSASEIPPMNTPASSAAAASSDAGRAADGLAVMPAVQAPDDPHEVRADDTPSFVANDAGLAVLANAIAGRLHRAVVLSDRARHKRVTGQLDLTRPKAVLKQLTNQMGLLSYDDGSSIYLYDDAEIKNAVVSMQHATVRNVRDFVRETHLLDANFPIRGDDAGGTFYVTGAPIYVNLITAAAKYLDRMRGSVQTGKQVVKVVTLQNSFVDDRRYMLRDQPVDIPGMATVLSQIFAGQPGGVAAPDTHITNAVPDKEPAAPRRDASPFSLSDALPAPASEAAASPAPTPRAGGVPVSGETDVRAVAYPDTNSIVLTGPLDKVQDMESLIHSLDITKRQIELSLWIIDIKKSCLDQLGVNWHGMFGSTTISGGFNGASNSTTLNGPKFLASIMALHQNGDATIVSRPVLLTQENMPAVFDNNQTFYARLIGERAVSLEHVTYGTMINVVPRLTADSSQVEMQVDVEDGNANDDGNEADSESLPLVNRTEIDTVARVPRDMSLLIGGNTRDDARLQRHRIPGLASIPWIGGLFRWHTESHDQVVRVFLIQPKVLRTDATWQRGQAWEAGYVGENAALRATVNLLRPYMGAR